MTDPANTPPAARLVHRTPKRARLRLPAARREPALLTRVERALSALPTVRAAQAEPLTASVLIFYHGDLDTLLAEAEHERLFALEPVTEADSPGTLLQRARSGGAHFDGWLRRKSAGNIDLESACAIGLVAAGVWQIARGKVLPAGFNLLWQAAALMREPEVVSEAAAGE